MQKENQLKSCLTSPLAGEDARKASEWNTRKKTLLSPLIGFERLRTQNHFPRRGGSHTASGFTLIELLVVVLIIGILASVAVPQYKKAVEKVHFTNAVARAEAIRKQIELWMLTNGAADNTFWQHRFLGKGSAQDPIEELSVDMTAGLSCDISSCHDGHYLYSAGPEGGGGVYAGRMGNDGTCCYKPELFIVWEEGSWHKVCSMGGDDIGKFPCNTLPADWEMQ